MDIGVTLGDPLSNADAPATSRADSGEPCGAPSVAPKRARDDEVGQELNTAKWRAVECDSANGASGSADVEVETCRADDSAGHPDVAVATCAATTVVDGIGVGGAGHPDAANESPSHFINSEECIVQDGAVAACAATEGACESAAAKRALDTSSRKLACVAKRRAGEYERASWASANDESCLDSFSETLVREVVGEPEGGATSGAASTPANIASDDGSNLVLSAANWRAIDSERAKGASVSAEAQRESDDIDIDVSVQDCQRESLGVAGQGVGQEEKPPPHPFTP